MPVDQSSHGLASGMLTLDAPRGKRGDPASEPLLEYGIFKMHRCTAEGFVRDAQLHGRGVLSS